MDWPKIDGETLLTNEVRGEPFGDDFVDGFGVPKRKSDQTYWNEMFLAAEKQAPSHPPSYHRAWSLLLEPQTSTLNRAA